MEIIKKIKESETIVIEGNKKVGKMTLALYFTTKLNKNATLISPLPASKLIKRVDLLSKSFKNFSHLKNCLSMFSLREDWISLKNEYGHKYLLEDLEYLISNQTNKIIIFHKINAFFEYIDRDIIETFLSELLICGNNCQKKFIFTLNSDDIINYDLINRYLVDNSELYLKMEIEEERKVEILYSLSFIKEKEYIFTNNDDVITLKPKENSENSKEISIVFISSNLHSRQLHRYLLDKDNINLVVVNTISDSLNAVLNNPDYLIFEQEDDEVKFSICEIAKKHNLNTKILYIVNKEFIRIDDRIKAKELGCIDMIKIDKNIMNYILELEKYLDFTFYQEPSNEDNFNKFNNEDEFDKYIEKMIQKRFLFTIVKIKNILTNEDISHLRKYDKVLITENYSMIFIFNTLKSNIEAILNKFNKKLEIEKIQDCLDLFF